MSLSSVMLQTSFTQELFSEYFIHCSRLNNVDINTPVIASYAFANCVALSTVTIGNDVEVINQYAFANTNINKFKLQNPLKSVFKTGADGAILYTKADKKLILVSPNYVGNNGTITLENDIEVIADGAFAFNNKVVEIVGANVKRVEKYAFSEAHNLSKVTFDNLEYIGEYAFYDCTSLRVSPKLDKVTNIGQFAFAKSKVGSVTIASNTEIGDYAFAVCDELETVIIGDNVHIGNYAFYSNMKMNDVDTTGDADNISNYLTYDYEVRDEENNLIKTYTYYRYNFNANATTTNLKSVALGQNVNVGNHAFYNATKLNSVILGGNVVVGDYAFGNCCNIASFDFSKVTSLGEGAFMGVRTRDLRKLDNGDLGFALDIVYENGQEYFTSYRYSVLVPKFETVDLSNVEKVGKGAFLYNNHLTTVTLNDNWTEIPEYLFAECRNLTSISLGDKVTEIGEYAFYNTNLANINLNNVVKFGEYAFAKTKLSEITIGDNAEVGAYSLAGCEKLTNVNNLNKASIIGDYAFINTNIEALNLENATKIGDFAFMNSKVTEVVFGNKLEQIGENPFSGCEIKTYGKYNDEVINNVVVGKVLVDTYDVSQNVKVIDGVLYKVVKNGLVLVSYPMSSEEGTYVVEEGTVRISASAFMNSKVKNVTLASTVKSIGDKAFFGCEKLGVVTFLSYNAPSFEEEYSSSYQQNLNNLALTGTIAIYEGLGISKYYMWNSMSYMSNFYYGANFVNYVGKVDNKITMVRPINGQNYNTFITSQYFDTVVMGASAKMQATIDTINLIENLPTNISLSDEQAVINARKAYDNIATLEQKALVSNYRKLTDAEDMIIYYKLRENSSSEEPTKPSKKGCNSSMNNTVAGLMAMALGVSAVCVFINRKKNNIKG